jgi:hypothetical protein
VEREAFAIGVPGELDQELFQSAHFEGLDDVCDFGRGPWTVDRGP